MSASSLPYRTLLIAAGVGGFLLLLLGLGMELRSQHREQQALEASLTVPKVTPTPSPTATPSPISISSVSEDPAPTLAPQPATQPSPTPDEEVVEIEEPAPTPEPLIVPAAVHPSRAAVAISPEERAVLEEGARQFSASLQGMSPYSPGYRGAWQQAAQAADDLFKVRYGEDRLWALKGGAPQPTPEPTPLSPEDDAYRAKYGDDALLVRQLERASKAGR
jgi:hypothetical protein